jgi:amino acid transporter
MTTHEAAAAPAVESREGGLARRAIGFWGALAMSIAAMGPLLGALAVAPLIVSQAGFSAPFIFVACWIAMATVAVTIGRFSRVLPGAASIYSYISHGLGEKVGFLSAWLSFGYYILFEPLLLVGFGIFTELAVDDVFGIAVDWWIWSLIAATIVFALSIIGIRLSMRIDLTLALIADGFLLVVALALIGKVIADGNFTLEPLAPTHAPGNFTGLSLAIAFGVLIFLGFEQSFVLGEEVSDPHGHVPKAIYTSLALVGTVLFTATFALVLGFGEGGIERLNELFASEGTPWFELVRSDLGGTWVDILEIMIVFSILSNTIASHNSVVRIQYGMGRARALPRQLGWTLAGPRTPYVAIIAQTAIALAITLIAGAVWGAETTFAFLGFMIGLAAAVAFLLILLAALRYFHRENPEASAFRNYVIPLIGILILIPVVYTSFYPNPGYPLKWAPWVLLIFVVVGAAFLFWRASRKEPVDLDYAFREIGETTPPAARATEPD